MTTIVTVSLNANSPCAIKWQPYNESVYYLIKPGETVDATHNIKNSGRIWHSTYDPLAGTESDTFIKDLPSAPAYCAGSSDKMGNSKYTGSVVWAFCDDGNPNTVDITILTAPDISPPTPAALLHLVTVPTGAYAFVDGQDLGGVTDQIYRHSMLEGEYKERVSVRLAKEHFKDKSFKKTLYAGLHEYALYRLSPATKIKGKTKKISATNSASFTFTLFKRTGSKDQIIEEGTKMRLLNMMNGQVRNLTTDATGAAAIIIPYEDSFFISGKQKLACILDDSADRIRTFRTITISRSLSAKTHGADYEEEDWHEEDESGLEELLEPIIINHEGITRRMF